MLEWLLFAVCDLTLKDPTLLLHQLSLFYLILITNSIVQLVFMMDILCIYCAVETEFCKVLLRFRASKC